MFPKELKSNLICDTCYLKTQNVQRKMDEEESVFFLRKIYTKNFH